MTNIPLDYNNLFGIINKLELESTSTDNMISQYVFIRVRDSPIP